MNLTDLGLKHGTDKGTIHSYLFIYEELTEHIREQRISLLEIGIHKGASVRMWLEWFPQGFVTAIDNNPANCINAPDRVRYAMADQSSEKLMRLLFNKEEFDIIIDDGSHEPSDQILSFHYLWRCLKPGGLYFVEDVRNDEIAEYWKIPGATVHLFHADGREDDILVIIRKTT